MPVKDPIGSEISEGAHQAVADLAEHQASTYPSVDGGDGLISGRDAAKPVRSMSEDEAEASGSDPKVPKGLEKDNEAVSLTVEQIEN